MLALYIRLVASIVQMTFVMGYDTPKPMRWDIIFKQLQNDLHKLAFLQTK